MKSFLVGTAFLLALGCANALAQQTTGNITGRVVDQQGGAMPGLPFPQKVRPQVSSVRRRATAKDCIASTRFRSATTR